MSNDTMLRFRVWNHRTKEFIKGYKKANNKLIFHGFCNDSQDDRNLGFSFWKNSDDYYRILKSTGLRDMNNIEIFEGDIIKDNSINGFGKIVFYGDVIWDIDYQVGGNIPAFLIDWNDGSKECSFIDKKRTKESIEVIGNIFENKELLESKNGK